MRAYNGLAFGFAHMHSQVATWFYFSADNGENFTDRAFRVGRYLEATSCVCLADETDEGLRLCEVSEVVPNGGFIFRLDNTREGVCPATGRKFSSAVTFPGKLFRALYKLEEGEHHDAKTEV